MDRTRCVHHRAIRRFFETVAEPTVPPALKPEAICTDKIISVGYLPDVFCVLIVHDRNPLAVVADSYPRFVHILEAISSTHVVNVTGKIVSFLCKNRESTVTGLNSPLMI